MSFFYKVILFIKNIFNKQEEVKQIEASKSNFNKKEEVDFFESLRCETVKNRKIETLVCVGDGLGIKRKISS